MKELPEDYKSLIHKATTELFESIGVENPKEKDPANTFSDGKIMNYAVIGFAGMEMKGTFVLTTDGDFLLKTHPNNAMDLPIEENDKTDWLGELSNQLLGRFKNLILKHGADFGITSPTVIKGQEVMIEQLGSNSFQDTFEYNIDKHVFAVKVEIEILKDIDFSKEIEKDVEEEGATLFF